MNVVSTLLIALALSLAPPSAAGAKSRKCPKLKDKKPFVYAIGSSTLGSYLGGFLKRDLPKLGFEFRKWGKASSGLARPDYHDWFGRVPEIVKEWKPDVFIVSLGTNDFQRLWTSKGWIKVGSPKWEVEYANRVDKMLVLASGKRKKRPVIWVGPGIFNQPKARRMAQLINRIVKERIAKFDGPAFHVDVVSQVLGKRGRPVKRIRVKGHRAKVLVFQSDRIHMTRMAIKHLMVRPILSALRECKKGGSIALK